MAEPRPTLQLLDARAKAETEAKLDGAEARLHGTPERILATVSAGQADGQYGRIERAERNLFPHLVEDRHVDEALKIWKVSDGQGGFGRIKARKATGKATFTGMIASVVATGTELQIGDEVYLVDVGYTYVQTIEVHEFDITAKVAGDSANADPGASISLVTPIAGVTSPGTVSAGGVINGIDQETLAAAKVRLVARIKSPGAGGARGDFEGIAKAASSSVTRAWELPRENGQGTMVVLIANDNENPPAADSTLIATVLAYMQSTDADGYITGNAPTTAIVTVASVSVPATGAVEVTAAVELDDGAIWEDEDLNGVKRDIGIEIASLVAAVSKPAVTITTEELSGAIQRTAGVKSHTLTLPAADLVYGAQAIPFVGTHTLTEA